MSSKKETQNTIKPHTEAKLKFYIHYLEIYLPILYKTPYVNNINIYDMFCGQAIYKDGKESSAVRAFNKIKEVQKNNPKSNIEITLTLNDLDKKRIKTIKEWLNKQLKTFKTHIHNEDATDLIKKLIQGINKQNQQTRNLVFIDPYGYKEIANLLIKKLLQNKRTEVIIFLPINQMNRFKGKIAGEDVEKDFLPLKNFMEQFNIEEESATDDKDLIKKIEKSFSFNDDYFSTSYHIKNEQRKHYALFFMTSNILGLEKIIEVKWKLDEQQGSGFNNTNQIDMFLEVEKKSELKEGLKRYIKETRNNSELYKWTIKQGFLPKHINLILKQWQKNKQLKITPEGTRKGSFYINKNNYKQGKSINIQLL